MAKRITSYLAPLVGMAILALADLTVIVTANSDDSPGIVLFLVIYNVLVFMAFASLMAAMFGDPGYVPHNYKVNLRNMSRLLCALYKSVIRYQDARPEDHPNKDAYIRARALAKYEFVLPLERGDGTTVIRGHYGNTTSLEVGVKGIVDPDHLFDSASTQNMKQSERMIASYKDGSIARDFDMQMSVRNADKVPVINQNTSL